MDICIDSSMPCCDVGCNDSIKHATDSSGRYSNEPKEHLPRYSLIERIFRVCVFQFAVYSYGWMERVIMRLFQMGRKGMCCPEMFNEKRAIESLSLFEALGAKRHEVMPKDGGASIHMITLKAEDLEERLRLYGACWDKMMIIDEKTKEQKEIMAITVPSIQEVEIEGKSFEEFEKMVLAKFSWKRERVLLNDGTEKEVIVTCKDASKVRLEEKQCFLYCHSPGGPFIRDRARAGLYVGMKQDLCYFDHRGTWLSKGIPSEAGYYLDADAVYDRLREEGNYDPSQIWAVGFCGGSAIAAYLKAKHHGEGLNFIEEQGFSDLTRDMIEPQHKIVKMIAKASLSALKSRDIPEVCLDKPKEDFFSTEEKWRRLTCYRGKGGKVVLIHAENDTTLGPSAVAAMHSLAHKVSEKVSSISFSSPEGTDGHNFSFYEYESAKKQFIEAVFQ